MDIQQKKVLIIMYYRLKIVMDIYCLIQFIQKLSCFNSDQALSALLVKSSLFKGQASFLLELPQNCLN